MKKIYTGIAVLCLIANVALAENAGETQKKPRTDANITGHVESARTQEHLPYITISVKGTTLGTVTDATGHYLLKDMPVDEITLVASAVGYKPEEQTIRPVKGKLLEVNFLLEEEAVSMDEVVVSATRNETNKRSSAVIVNVASTKLFESTASCTLSETIAFQPGLRIENSCGNCGAVQLRINGLEGQYSQVLLDSRPIFSSLAGVYGLEQLPVSMIERVEVVRGGGSALFGSSAIGGVVNIITKDALRNTLSVSNTTNIFETGDIDTNTSFSGSFVSDDHKAGIYLFGMVRDRDPYDRNGDGFSDVTKIESETVGFRGYYKTSAHSRLTAEYHHIHEFRRGGDNFERPAHEAFIAEQLDHKIDGGGLTFDIFTPDSRHRGSVYSSAQRIARKSYFGTDMTLDTYGDTKDITFTGGGQYTYGMRRLLFMPAELTAGLEYTYNDLNDLFPGLRSIEQTVHVVGGFLQNEWKNDRLSILLGGRLDKHSMMNNVVFSPRANVRYSPIENVGLRVSYSSGYRAPQAYDEDLHIFATSGKVSVINQAAELKPEYSHSFSASADLYHTFGRWQGNLLIEGFHTTLNDVFELHKLSDDAEEAVTGIIRWERQNAPGAVVKGLNLEGKIGLPGVFEFQAGFTVQSSLYKEPYTWAENSPLEPQRKMFRSPDNYGYFTSLVNITRNFKASVFANYTGPMLVQHTFHDPLTGLDTDLEKTTQGFFDAGFKFFYNFKLSAAVNLELNCGVKNVFDSFQNDLDYGKMKDAAYVYGPSFPRMFFFGVKLSM